MRLAVLAVLIAVGATANAQTPLPPQILVSAIGSAMTPPDMVTVGFTLRGEGATSDEATSKLRESAKAMSTGVAGLLQKAEDYHSSAFSIAQVRSKECDGNNYGQQRLSTGACAVIGYVAMLPIAIDTNRVADAGTLVSLIGRLGGTDVRLRNFWLRDNAMARRSAMQAALRNAKDQAQLIAEGSGGRLGQLLRVQDADYREVTLEMPGGERSVVNGLGAPPAPPPPPPPVRIELAPEPIQTTVRLMAAYAIER